MISSWLLKVIVGIVLIGAAVLELGSPLIARAQVDDAAHNVADEVAFQLRTFRDDPALQEACRVQADRESVELVACRVVDRTKVEVTVRKEAWSFLLKNWSVTEDWYHPEATAVADGPS